VLVGSPGKTSSGRAEEILRILYGPDACCDQRQAMLATFVNEGTILLGIARSFTEVIEVIDRDEFADLVEAVAARRDRAAFIQLYDHFSTRIYAFLLRPGLEPAAAEDLTQEVMTKLWLRAKQFDRTRSSVATWLFRIARNARIDYLRRQRGEPPLGEEALSVADPAQAPDDALNAAQWEERVRAAMTNLPAEQLAIVKLAFFDGLSHSEIAHQTGLPLGTVKARIRLALTRLRRGL
jgi:RNA polymerase sigma-70 factor (ECF subfamily)